MASAGASNEATAFDIKGEAKVAVEHSTINVSAVDQKSNGNQRNDFKGDTKAETLIQGVQAMTVNNNYHTDRKSAPPLMTRDSNDVAKEIDSVAHKEDDPLRDTTKSKPNGEKPGVDSLYIHLDTKGAPVQELNIAGRGNTHDSRHVTQPSILSDEANLTHGTKDGVWTQLSTLIYMKKEPFRAGTRIYEAEQRNTSRTKRLAIKLTDLNKKNLNEAKALAKLSSHSNVVQIVESRELNDGHVRQFYIAMELCHYDNLQDHIETNVSNNVQFSFNQTMTYTKQLVAGILFIHENGIIHRDLKPENVLFSLDKKFLKIADFGISKELRKGRSVTRTSSRGFGTDGYRAPETYKSDIISKKADIYSLGLVIYFMWSNGKHPFGPDEHAWVLYIKNNQNLDLSELLILEEGPKNELTQLLHLMLEVDPEHRVDATAVNQSSFFCRGTPAATNIKEGRELTLKQSTSEDYGRGTDGNLVRTNDSEIDESLSHGDGEIIRTPSFEEFYDTNPDFEELSPTCDTGDVTGTFNTNNVVAHDFGIEGNLSYGDGKIIGAPCVLKFFDKNPDLEEQISLVGDTEDVPGTFNVNIYGFNKMTNFDSGQEESLTFRTGEFAGISNPNIDELSLLKLRALTPECDTRDCVCSEERENLDLSPAIASVMNELAAESIGQTAGSDEYSGASRYAACERCRQIANVGMLSADSVVARRALDHNGGVIYVEKCKLVLEPWNSTRDSRIELCITVFPQVNDIQVPEGHQAISPLFRCSPSGYKFRGHASVTLPLCVTPRRGIPIQILCKTKPESLWIEHMCLPTADNNDTVTFTVGECAWYMAALTINFPCNSQTLFQNFLLFDKASATLCVLTCLADDTLKEKYIADLKDDGFRLVSPLPDNLAFMPNEKISYQLVCQSPRRCQIQPEEKVELNGAQIISDKYAWRYFKLLPPPTKITKQIEITYIVDQLNPPRKKKSFLTIDCHADIVGPSAENFGSLPSVSHQTTQYYQSFEENVADIPAREIELAKCTPQEIELFKRDVGSMHLRESTLEFYYSHLYDKTVYPIDPDRAKGKVLIISNEFLNPHVDAENMHELWNALGFEVKVKYNLSAADMHHVCTRFASEASKVSCLAVIIISPGGKYYDDKVYFKTKDDKKVFMDKLLCIFTSRQSPNLNGIPKVFLFQVWHYRRLEISYMPTEIFVLLQSDMFAAYSCSPGHVARGSTLGGSLFMNAIANVLIKRSCDTRVLHMLQLVKNITNTRGVDEKKTLASSAKKLFLFPGWPKKLSKSAGNVSGTWV